MATPNSMEPNQKKQSLLLSILSIEAILSTSLLSASNDNPLQSLLVEFSFSHESFKILQKESDMSDFQLNF